MRVGVYVGLVVCFAVPCTYGFVVYVLALSPVTRL
jgi:hypothetical protein